MGIMKRVRDNGINGTTLLTRWNDYEWSFCLTGGIQHVPKIPSAGRPSKGFNNSMAVPHDHQICLT